MSTNVTVRPDAVEVDFTGIDAALALRRHLHIPLTDVIGATVAPVSDLKRTLGWRIAGGYFPGRFATGLFSSRKPLTGRQLWSVYRDADALVVDLREGSKLRRVVLQTPKRADLARQITRLAGV